MAKKKTTKKIKDSKVLQSQEEGNLNLANVVSFSDKIIVAKNKTKSWKYGYNDKYDFIVISKQDRLEKYLIFKD